MDDVERRLASIGYGATRREPCRWRTQRVSEPEPAGGGSDPRCEPAQSRVLLRWRDLLAEGRPTPPYRIIRTG